MLCSQCQKEIPWGKEVKVSRSRFSILSSDWGWQEEKWYCLPCYEKRQSNKRNFRKKKISFGWLIVVLVLVGIVAYLLWKGINN